MYSFDAKMSKKEKFEVAVFARGLPDFNRSLRVDAGTQGTRRTRAYCGQEKWVDINDGLKKDKWLFQI